ncbi:MAG TPA: hypothetical protein VFM93_08080 [Candidatus Limnocylindria bacterium]|nr:hypothetical protein [Candidatus Limnocylindria bacterium]
MTDARRIHGVISIRSEPETQRLVVRFDAARTDERSVTRAVQEAVDRVH